MSSHLKFPSICRVEGCDRIALSKNLCGMHYQQTRRGQKLVMRSKEPIAAAKPWEFENPEGERQLMEQYGDGR